MEEIKEACGIKIGEYVRTKKGIIAKVQAYQELKIYDEGDKQSIFISYETDRGTIADIEIKNHSLNIIDLIQVGDLIQLRGAEKLKYEVLKISYSDSKGKHIHIINPFRTEGGKDIFIEDISSIVTEEQFQNSEYKLEV